jgi:prepilin-type N-terminal cleavage/methylation domain-containing protein
MRHNIVKRPVGMVTLRTPYLMRDASSLRRRMKYGIRRIRYNPLGCYSGEDQHHLQSASVGFTVIELLIVVVIIAIAAMAAIPMITSADSFQIRSAANMIAADLEYAKTISISRGQSFSVVFDDAAETYRIEDQSGVVIGHPVKKGFDYIVDFQSDRRLSKVDIESVSFDATSEVKFDYLGSPYNGADNPLNSGVISLRAGQMTATVNIEPITGFISIAD